MPNIFDEITQGQTGNVFDEIQREQSGNIFDQIQRETAVVPPFTQPESPPSGIDWGALSESMASREAANQAYGAGQQPGTELTNALFNDLPGKVMKVMTFPGRLAYNAAADLISKLPSFDVQVNGPGAQDVQRIKQDYGGNLAAMFSGGELPVDKFLSEVSKTNPNLAVAGKLGQEMSAMSPLAAVGALPSWAAKLISAGFTADMIAGAPELFKQYAEEKNKPKDEQDPDKLTSLQASVLTTFAFAPAAGMHGIGSPLEAARAFSRGSARLGEARALEAPLPPQRLTEPQPPIQGELNATQERPQQESSLGQHPQTDAGGPPTETVDSNSTARGGAVTVTPEAQAVAPEPVAPALPDLPPGERLVTIEREDGTTYQATFGDKFYDASKMGLSKQTPQLGRLVNGTWSHGFLRKGERLLEEGKSPPPTVAAAPTPPAAPLPGEVPQPPARFSRAGEDLATQMGPNVKFDGERNQGTPEAPNLQWSYTETGPNGFKGNTISVRAGATPEEVKTKFEAAKKATAEAPRKTEAQVMAEMDQWKAEQAAKEAATKAAQEAPAAAPTPATAETPGAPTETIPSEMTPMGGDVFNPAGPTGSADVTGVAERVRQKREAAGKTAPTVPGEGIAPEASVELGRKLLADGADPEAAMAKFESDNKFSSNDFALVRAHAERLARETNKIEEIFGTDSPEWRKAFDTESAWAARTKKMQTEWAKSGHAQQGEVDIDTGTFTGLARAFKEKTGKDFTPDQKATAVKRVKQVKAAETAAQEAQRKLNEKLADEFPTPDETTPEEFKARTEKALEEASNPEGPPVPVEYPPGSRNTGSGSIAAAHNRAIAATHKTVREAAIRLAQAENRTLVATTAEKRTTAKIQEKAARKALESAQAVARRNAIKAAAEVMKALNKEAGARKYEDQNKAAQAALKSANEVVRDAAMRLADAENKQRSAKAESDKKVAAVQAKAAKKAFAAANQVVRNQAVKAAKAASENHIFPERRVWKKVNEYLDAGELGIKFDDLATYVATDLGILRTDVIKLLNRNPTVKSASHTAWLRQQELRRFKDESRSWVNALNTPAHIKVLRGIPSVMFGLKVGFHGTVALGTHAPTLAFQPRYWADYARNFAKMYRMVFSKATYEMEVQNLLRTKNYTVARRSGLVNDPYIGEDYNSPEIAKYMKFMTRPGNRGYTVLKLLRQDLFDRQWDRLPQTARSPEMAAAISDGVNHVTGVVKVSAPSVANLALFAPRLMASRAAWLVTDPVRALDTGLRWKTATQAEKHFAMNQVKEKAWVAGTFLGLLAINQGLLSASGSKQKINGLPKAMGGDGFDPMRSDFMKFKVGGMTVSYGNAMLGMARLPVRLWTGVVNDSKLNKLIYEDENTATTLFDYLRSQASPFAGTAADLAFGRDYAERPLPRSGFGLLPGKTAMRKRMRQQGIKPYSWPEYLSEAASPIPLSEGIKEVWKTGFGASDEQISAWAKAMAISAWNAGFGGRMTEDYTVEHKP